MLYAVLLSRDHLKMAPDAVHGSSDVLEQRKVLRLGFFSGGLDFFSTYFFSRGLTYIYIYIYTYIHTYTYIHNNIYTITYIYIYI